MGKPIRVQRRGKGSLVYRARNHYRKGPAVLLKLDSALHKGFVRDIVHDPGRGAPLLQAQFGTKAEMFICPEGIHVGQEIFAGKGAPLTAGNCLPVGEIPEGALITKEPVSAT